MSKISNLQKYLKQNKIDYFLVNRTDEFLNEYIAPYAERLGWLTGFSGSAGRLIVSTKSLSLFVDGRYTFQAKQQVDKKKIIIKHYESYWENLTKIINSKANIAIYAKTHSINEIFKIKKIIKKSKSNIICLDENPIDILWKNQPTLPNFNIFDHSIKFAGLNRNKKIKHVQSILRKKKIDFYLLTSLDSIAWLLNMRGNDIDHTPLFFSNLLITQKGKLTLFCSVKKIKKNLAYKLIKLCDLKELEKIEYILKKLPSNSSVSMDYNNTSYYFHNLFKNCGQKISHLENPCLLTKAIKNLVEVEGARKANIRDGASLVKFLYWLKNLKNINQISEIEAAKKIYRLRKNNKLFVSLSFDTISAAGENSALPHYRVTKKTDHKLEMDNIYLIDSGAQYYDGTTDITRTIIIGSPSDDKKNYFTRVLKGHIAIATHKFPSGTRGSDIDYLARKSLNEIGCDYDHGTGHGIGSFLSVHEGPQRIAKKSKVKSCVMYPGMIISNEPGYYSEKNFGIRIENLIVVSKISLNKLGFETISFAPIDRDLINKDLLNKKETLWINDYHLQVYKKLNIYLNKNQKKWLKKVTSPL